MKVKNAFITKTVDDSAVGAGWGRELMALLGLPKRAINPRPHWSHEKRFPNGNLFLKIKNKLRNKNIF